MEHPTALYPTVSQPTALSLTVLHPTALRQTREGVPGRPLPSAAAVAGAASVSGCKRVGRQTVGCKAIGRKEDGWDLPLLLTEHLMHLHLFLYRLLPVELFEVVTRCLPTDHQLSERDQRTTTSQKCAAVPRRVLTRCLPTPQKALRGLSQGTLLGFKDVLGAILWAFIAKKLTKSSKLDFEVVTWCLRTDHQPSERDQISFSSLLLSSLELSDTKVYEPYIRARLGTTAHFCEVVVQIAGFSSLGLH